MESLVRSSANLDVDGAFQLRYRRDVLAPLLVFMVACALFSLYGANGILARDDAVYMYSGQQLARGVPPYASILDGKTPLAPIIVAGGVIAADALGVDDLLTVRYMWLVLSALCAAAVYLLAASLFESREAGLVAALVFVAYWGFGVHALSGPRAKTPMVLFVTLSMYFNVTRRWFGAGLCGSLAAATWQPTAVFTFASVTLAGLQSPPERRRRHIGAAIAGAALPVLGLLALFAALDGLPGLLDGSLIYHLYYLERPPRSWVEQVAAIGAAVEMGYSGMLVPIVAGFATIIVLYGTRAAAVGYDLRELANDRFAVLLITFPAPILWSLVDFQGYPDFYVFLPYTATGCAALVTLILQVTDARRWLPSMLRQVVPILLAVVLALWAAFQYSTRGQAVLQRQRELFQDLARRAGPAGEIVSMGAPEIMVLLRRTNPNPYLFVCCGMTRYIDEHWPGGLDGWLQSIAAREPAVIVFGPQEFEFADALRRRLPSRYELEPVARWLALVRRD